jgi:hypothetical protein
MELLWWRVQGRLQRQQNHLSARWGSSGQPAGGWTNAARVRPGSARNSHRAGRPLNPRWCCATCTNRRSIEQTYQPLVAHGMRW